MADAHPQVRNWPRLARPVHFVCPRERIWPELLNDGIVQLPDDVLAERSVDGTDTWTVRTAYELRLRGARASISDRPRDDAINVCHVYDISRKRRGLTAFFVVARADGHETELANYLLLQSFASRCDLPHTVIRFWLQPGLIPRDPQRGDRVETLSFKGIPRNFDSAFSSDVFKGRLAALGVVLDLGEAFGGDLGRVWADYGSSDVVLAVRNLTAYDAANKPASKLLNAWKAGVPALLGPEPAFAEVGRPGRDYIEVRTPDDVIDAVKALKAEPARYRSIIDEGKRRSVSFTDDAAAMMWFEALNGPIAEAYDAWSGRSRLSRAITVARKMLREPASKRRHRDAFTRGARILHV